ncbi:MAG: hypothetical protein JSS79_05280 [Bacteroidetes bacterium]|nr:hypothetical protein [Bacteroidota bacterium]
MSLSGVTINKSTNNLGRARLGNDHISGLLVYSTPPIAFGTSNVVSIGSVAQAEALGITSSSFAVLHYHISEYFRLAGNSLLYVGIFAHAGSNGLDFSEIQTMQRVANGTIRQIGVYLTDDLTSGIVSQLQTQKTALDGLKTPLSIVLTANIVGVTLPDFSAATSTGVSVITDQAGDSASVGATLFAASNKTVGCLGACLGAISLVDVATSIGSVSDVPNLAGSELDVIADGAGNLYTSFTKAQISSITDLGYLKLVKHEETSGTFFNDDVTCGTGDLDSIHLNRVIDKATRGVVSGLAPKINGKVLFNSDGSISENTAKLFESLAAVPLALMKSVAELSDFSVFVNPNQNVQGTDNLNVIVELLPVGVSKVITVNIGFTTSV